jgi:hypothetical protein
LIRLISPIKLIRFGVLNSYRIGHFAGNIEMYMCEECIAIENAPIGITSARNENMYFSHLYYS